MSTLLHRMRCITVKAGSVFECPECGKASVCDWYWDFRFDPDGLSAGTVPVYVAADDLEALPMVACDGARMAYTKEEWLRALRQIGTVVSLPCEACFGLDRPNESSTT